MWEWNDKLKLGKSSAFVKRGLRVLPLTDAEFEADFFLDPVFSIKRQEHWRGMVVERQSNGLLAMEDVRFPPPTVNNLASLLAHAMQRPPDYENRQRPNMIYLRNRPQWQELVPHLGQLGIKVAFSEDLPWFDEAVIEWVGQAKGRTLPPVDEITSGLRKPFPTRKRSHFTDVMSLLEWTDAMCKGAYPSRENAVPLYDPETVVPVRLAAEELEIILAHTRIAKTKKLRPRLEAMAGEGKAIELGIHDWSNVMSALCGAKEDKQSAHSRMFEMATRIANQLAKALNIEPPDFSVK